MRPLLPLKRRRGDVVCRDHRFDIVFAIRVAAWEEEGLSLLLLLVNSSASPVSLSDATGVFEYSGQEVKNTSSSPPLFCVLLSVPKALNS